MSQFEQVHPSVHTEPVVPPPPPTAVSPQISTAGLDAILDEIDEVLEVNAQEFVNAFVQKGGQ